MKVNKYFAFIEAPLQLLCLENININKLKKIYIIKRENWPIDEIKINLRKNISKVEFVTPTEALLKYIYHSFTKDKLIIGSHLGFFNKFLINVAIIFKKNLLVLDDGNFSCKSPNWLIKHLKKNDSIVWQSCFLNNSLSLKNLKPYCLAYNEIEFFYENYVFLLLPDFEGLGITLEDEKLILESLINKSLNKDILVFPHRRGRHNLYRELGLKIGLGNEICFEEWYLKSEFKNCTLYGAASSAFNVLRDKRLKIFLIKHKLLKFHSGESHFYKDLDGELSV